MLFRSLNEAEALGLKQLKKITKLKDKEVIAALGWLARENKVTIDVDPEDAKELIIALVK